MSKSAAKSAKSISEPEQARRQNAGATSIRSYLPESVREQLLFSREQTRRLLGNVSTMTIIRLEAAGRLRAVRLNPHSKSAMVFYRRADIDALVQGASG